MDLNVSAMPLPITPTVLTVLTRVCAGASKRLPLTYVIIRLLYAPGLRAFPGGNGPGWSVQRTPNINRRFVRQLARGKGSLSETTPNLAIPAEDASHRIGPDV